MMSGDDSEENFRERIKEDLAEFEKEYASKDWIFPMLTEKCQILYV